ncbi:hypothetical protein BXT86_01140 [candidate division WOR-3 bacterium 4484_100]|uniref:Glycosyl transferase family 1 n=1 Tax=candidate division WOR-3 bacterium 4484_100 TaxID=1936077 RepID=A0A1V4QGR0_UNCW3|nr:MAG: hypothetical protein BXT86_01140 [candidate division WOR-3 bacterium 4484_100]
MDILLINTFHYNRGGDCIYTFELADLLRGKRHKVVHFAMEHPLNFTSEYSKYFVPEIDLLRELKKKSLISGLKVLNRAIYSNISKKKLSLLLDEHPVDIAHIQNIHGHITPSVFHILKKRNIPIVWTLHDYFLLCPNSTFYSKGKVCEACRGNKFYKAVINRCRKNSFAASVIVVFEEYIHRLLGLLRLVDYFITPSLFLKKKLVENKFPEDKIVHIPNFISIDNGIERNRSGPYALYGGRLSYEKGLKTLIRAVSSVSGIKLLIAGDGPYRKEIEKEVDSVNKHRIEFLGHQPRNVLLGLIKGAMFIIIPSEWYENFPYSILETFASGRPVVGAKIGGIPELIKEGETGLLFEPGNTEDLAEKIRWMFEHPAEREKMGQRAREYVLQEYNPDLHYERIMEVYHRAIKKHKVSGDK